MTHQITNVISLLTEDGVYTSKAQLNYVNDGCAQYKQVTTDCTLPFHTASFSRYQ